MTGKQNNKERVPYLHYLERMKKADPASAAKRCGAEYDAETRVFSLRLLDRERKISYPDAESADGTELSAAERLLLMRYLLEGRLVPASGRFLNYREMPWGDVYETQFAGRCTARLAYMYGAAAQRFAAAMEEFGAQKIGGADAAYEIEFMKGLYLRFLLWDADDEFPPSAQILFSDNFQFAFSAEDIAVIGDIVIGRVKKQMHT